MADKETADRLDHLIADVHDISMRFQVLEEKVLAWEKKAAPLLKAKEAAAGMFLMGKGRHARKD